MRSGLRTALTLAVLALTAGPVGTSVFVLGFGAGDSPCVLCWAQRTTMALVALVGLFVLRHGPRPRYLGLGILIAAAGLYMGIRHAALHVARDIGQGFSVEILGAHTYTWSAFIFWVAILVMAGLLMGLRDGEATRVAVPLRPVERGALWLFLLVTAGNIVQAFASTGPPPYMGQSDPVRFSFNPAHWVWSLEEWAPAPLSMRGRYAIEKPSLAMVTTDPSRGPFLGLARLAPRRLVTTSLPLDGPVTDLAYDPEADHFAVATGRGLYVVPPDFDDVVRRVIIDTAFSVDLATLAGATCMGPRTWLAMGINKSYVTVRENPTADARANFRFFLAGGDQFDEVGRSRLATVRARMMYVLSAAYDPASHSVFTISVPNARVTRLVVSRFDAADMTLSEEFVPAIDTGAGLAWRDAGRSLGDLLVTGATWHQGRLHAVSATDATLLTIDPERRVVTGAWTLGAIQRPTGLAIRRGELHVIDETGRVAVYEVPSLPTAAGLPPGPLDGPAR